MLFIDEKHGYKRILTNLDIYSGSVIMHLSGEIKSYATRYSIQINKASHLHPNDVNEAFMKKLIWPYLNHSCNPNTYVDVEKLQLIALRTILPTEEITFDYETTETIISAPFKCECKSSNCKAVIKGKAVVNNLTF